MRLVETKKKEYSYGKIEAYHNADPIYMHLNNEPMQPDDGVGSTQRIGDVIYQRGFKVKMMLYNKSDRPNLTWQVRVCSVRRGDVSQTAASGTISKSQFYRQIAGNALLDDVENARYKVVKSYRFKNPQIQANVTAGAANANECVTTKSFYVAAPQKIEYSLNGNEYPTTGRDYLLVVDCFDAYGSLVTDNIGAVQCLSTMFYKDP
jgi:hypothetical protein